jgi:hypothetical protein
MSLCVFHSVRVRKQENDSRLRRKSLKQAVESCRLVRRRGSHIFYTVGSQMAVRLSALRTGSALSTGRSWYSFLLEAESITGPSEAGRIG